jgi:hypothetical protein
MLVPGRMSRPATRIGALTLRRMRSIRSASCSWPGWLLMTRTNSSPPTRATVSFLAHAFAQAAAVSRSTTSPASWPKLSLMCLKLSRSRKASAPSTLLRTAKSIACLSSPAAGCGWPGRSADRGGPGGAGAARSGGLGDVVDDAHEMGDLAVDVADRVDAQVVPEHSPFLRTLRRMTCTLSFFLSASWMRLCSCTSQPSMRMKRGSRPLISASV